MSKKLKKFMIGEVIFLVVLAIAIGVSMAWSQDIELALGLLYQTTEEVPEEDIVIIDRRNAGEVALATDSELAVHFMDVGQGDCAVVCLPDGKNMVIDGGDNKASVEKSIKEFMDNTFDASFEYFDYAILTHADADHCGSLDYMLENYPARVVYRPNVEAVGTAANPYVDPGKADLTPDALSKVSASYAKAVAAMYAANADFTPTVYVTDPSNSEYDITGGEGDGEYSLTFYSPLSDKYKGEGADNNYSPIMILEYRGFKYAMSGDAEEGNLEEFVAKVSAAKSDGVTDKYDAFDDNYCVNVIKAGHHGSENATTPEYLETITSPSGAKNAYCVISCGAGNKYGHPDKAAIDRYTAIGVPDANILRTDIAGDITISVRMDENGVFKMFYGEQSSEAGKPVDPDDEEEYEPPVGEAHYVYMEVNGVKLTWGLVAWSVYGVIVVGAVLQILSMALRSTRKK